MSDKPTPQVSDSGTPPLPKPTFSRAAGFVDLYANNVTFETSVWDLKLIFALFEQSPDAPPFKQLASVRLPWPQAKLLAYLMAMQVAFHEASNGTVEIPQAVRPPDIEKFVAEQFPNDEKAKGMAERVNRIRAELGL